jgi:acyl-CoA thioesterase-2
MNASPDTDAARQALDGLLALLELEKIEENIFRGQSAPISSEKVVFGGQVVAQALTAAARTVPPERAAHSLHAYFILPGDPDAPIVYDVDRIRNGGSFTTRRVVAIQKGEAIFNLSASFQVAEEGFEHQVEMPDVPPPEKLDDERTRHRDVLRQMNEKERDALSDKTLRGLHARAERAWPVTFRPVDPQDPLRPDEGPPERRVWMRAAGPLPDDPALHRALLAFASDFGLLRATMRPHGLSFIQPDFLAASLDHALWLHRRRFRLDEWLLYDTDGPSAGGGRGLSRGQLFTREGRLVASVAQEGLMRRRKRDA